LQQGRYHLPERYLDDRLFALALDKSRMWVHWAEGTAVKRIAARFFPSGWESAPRRLRVQGAHEEARVVECCSDYGSSYVEGLMSGVLYRVEYGMELDGRFFPVFETRVRMPGTISAGLSKREQPGCISSYSIYSV
jgi:hypothetical protein